MTRLCALANYFWVDHPMFHFFIVTVGLFFYTHNAVATGENTYKQVCAVCHQMGVAKAPKVGDKAQWAPLIREGQSQLTAHGYVGIRGMPAKGGKADLSVADFAASLVYMVNQSGGSWQNPDAKMLERINVEIIKQESRKKK
jgi:mono/diheme cytochrome c family protein